MCMSFLGSEISFIFIQLDKLLFFFPLKVDLCIIVSVCGSYKYYVCVSVCLSVLLFNGLYLDYCG